ncbi:monovalent cation:proton antiporter-2 (CPA2) family protein [Aquisalinus flavus]|uniref:Potassium efflux system protein n=1 Tax=Aquisalinus flavus TaxID=1526572 RepID=A0A8J2V3Q1_9PROT|nr:monovalent cation:proton antiporter-2 (CPA2) family protein [Aquisalinus flavus]MBD0426702.1 cation:proton antiporter [Aquisalinus flavus]UNE46572.1 potassium transporter TrkA [Aquisalinus flavus]GGC95296.1 potassium efflux system protein [Aquisalinus flavus]
MILAFAGGAENNDFLLQAAIFLGATAIAVPLFRKLKLGTILGFLGAGVLFGEYGIGLLAVEEGVFHVAELGVVLFLFVIGLELSLSRLWSLRRNIFGLGLAQMLVTGIAISLFLWMMDILPGNAAAIAGFALACSSTAFALSLLQERNELKTPYGVKSFSILLFQDIAVIPLLAAIPFAVGMSGVNPGDVMNGDMARDFEWQPLAWALVVLAIVVLVARYVLNPVFRLVAASGSREAFTATALFVVAATALLVASAGLSMALGAFVAGVMLAESSYRHQIEADIEPFRELLLGLFFIGVGMQLDVPVIIAQWVVILAAAIGLIVSKTAIIYGLSRLFGSRHSDAMRSGLTLSQGGEFAFVVLSLGAGEGLFGAEIATVLSAIVTISMVFTPVLAMLGARMATSRDEDVDMDGIEELTEMNETALIVGYGRMGQIVAQILNGAGVAVTAIDNDPVKIDRARRFGAKVYFGDATNIHLLLTAGANSADMVFLMMRDRAIMDDTVRTLKAHCPSIRIIARAYDRMHEIDLLDHDIDFVMRETFESSIVMAQKGLENLGFGDNRVRAMIAEFRQRDKDRLIAQQAGGPEAGKEKMVQPFEAADLE